MTIAETVKKTNLSLIEKGLPDDSFFQIIFSDNSIIDERQSNWTDLSEQVIINDNGRIKTVLVCKYPSKSLTVNHCGLSKTIEVDHNEQPYQAIISMATLNNATGSVYQKIIGRRIGKIKDGNIVEEYIINSQTNQVIGSRYIQ
jgi:hypothetical protein